MCFHRSVQIENLWRASEHRQAQQTMWRQTGIKHNCWVQSTLEWQGWARSLPTTLPLLSFCFSRKLTSLGTHLPRAQTDRGNMCLMSNCFASPLLLPFFLGSTLGSPSLALENSRSYSSGHHPPSTEDRSIFCKSFFPELNPITKSRVIISLLPA